MADEQKPQPKKEREPKGPRPEGAKPEGTKSEGQRPRSAQGGASPQGQKPQAQKPQGGGAKGGQKAAPARDDEPQVPVTVANLKDRYEREIKPQLRGEAISNPKAMDAAAGDLATITGQRAVVTRSRKAISNFRLRKGMPIGLKVTLRGYRMWHFLEKLLTTALPRIRDFQGVPDRSFDGRGNYSLGLREQLVFPEIEYDKIDRLRGMEITLVTTARTDEEGRRLLQLLGMPFRRSA